jgi:hypothetical protein
VWTAAGIAAAEPHSVLPGAAEVGDRHDVPDTAGEFDELGQHAAPGDVERQVDAAGSERAKPPGQARAVGDGFGTHRAQVVLVSGTGGANHQRYAQLDLGSLFNDLDLRASTAQHKQRTLQQVSCKEVVMRAHFLGKDPDSQEGQSPTLFATDRTDRRTFIAQGWKVTDPEALADVGPVPDQEAIIEMPEDVLKFYVRAYQDQEGER